MSKAKSYCNVGSKIQTLLFSKEKYTVEQAKEWLKENDFLYGNVDTTGNNHRFRQEDSADFKENSFRTTNFHNKLPEGIQAVIGCPKHSDMHASMENGGGIDWDAREAELQKAWDSWTPEQKAHFIQDHQKDLNSVSDISEFPQKSWGEIEAMYRQDNDDNGEFAYFKITLGDHLNLGHYGKPVDYKIELIDYSVSVYEDDFEKGEGANVNNWNKKENITFDSAEDLLKYLATKVIYKDLAKADFTAFEDGRITRDIVTKRKKGTRNQVWLRKR